MTATTNPNRALWEKGDFTQIAATMRESGEALVGKLGITDGMHVLDLGCGDGTTAVPEAQLGAEVLGVDIASNLVAAGKARAEELGLTNLSFQQGDASNLNGLAWTCAENGVFLPEALQAAERAVKLEPKNTGILDTLAEVHFRMGNAAKAAEVESRALSLEPNDSYLSQQLARFRAGEK